jgi:hypothetical protein
MLLWGIWQLVIIAGPVQAAEEDEYYRMVTIFTPQAESDSRSKSWKPAPNGLALEVSGMSTYDDKKLAVTIRKGELWIMDGVYDDPPKNVTYKLFASALHEPLGLLWKDKSFYTVQRSELTKITDLDGDGVADDYETFARGWGLTGHYHEYAFGPKVDKDGNFWVTLNIGIGLKDEHKQRTINNKTLGMIQARWRGWGMKITPKGEVIPMCAGMRSPSGIGINAEGDPFYTDQQGNWVATNSLHHMRKGVFFHHPESLASSELPESPLKGIKSIPNGLPYPQALVQFPQMRPPAVWFPYKKVGQSATDVVLDESQGKFGPFAGQFFVGEFTQASINRVYLEKVDGEYQGACFPFHEGFASAVLRMVQGVDGSMFVGLSNRGWSSLGSSSYGLQRLVWTGKTPFEIQEMHAKSDGFELVFTQPVDPATASQVSSYAINSYTYLYHETYGSDEVQKKDLVIQQATVSPDGLRVQLKVAGLRPVFVHELTANGVRNASGASLLHPQAYYTLNKIPSSK